MGRRVRVLTICQIDDARGPIAELAERSMALRPDVVCLPESFSKLGLRDTREFEHVPGPTTHFFMQLAKAHHCYVICPLKTERDGRRWNSAVIIGRTGQILGVYDKMHPVTNRPDFTSFENVQPGEAATTFDLDFGRVGIQICFDIGFPETWASLAQGGARLVFWPSAYTGGLPLQAYAYQHHYYVVSSVRTDRSRIIDPCGVVVAETTTRHPVIYYDLSLDYTVAHYDFNFGVPAAIQARYGDRVFLRSCYDEGCFLVECRDEGVTIEQLQNEFGFESIGRYHERHRAGYADIQTGRPPEAQSARHGSRRQYG